MSNLTEETKFAHPTRRLLTLLMIVFAASFAQLEARVLGKSSCRQDGDGLGD